MTIKFTAKNFGCLKDFEIDLQPLHALIGPNDSGKSTVLRAIALAAEFVSLQEPALIKLTRLRQDLRRGAIELTIDNTGLKLARDGGIFERPTGRRVGTLGSPSSELHADGLGKDQWPNWAGDPLLVKLVPEHLREASKLIPEGEPLNFDGRSGVTLAGIYDKLTNDNPDAAQSIRNQVRVLFPTVDRLQQANTIDGRKAFKLLLTDGTSVRPEEISEGLLYYLAFAALPYLDVSGPILIEEPENGLHPARIREVMNVLKEVSKTSQVVIATHSPLVINELEPEQVSIITRDPETGSRATPMRETKNFEQRSKVYALGELWLSYADGEMEKDLVPAGSQT